MSQGMETFDARLASFDTVLHPGKRRSSTAKSAKPISWPHNSPSPAELAHAGFYYEPHETNPDNTRCFLCESALDGWEEEDNPITEHLTLSQNCGWAIMMDIQRHSSNPAEIEDPTSEKIEQARTATFGLLWPHDGKRGWVCQSEKMVGGGWYFCANEESTDLASCAYCKLSLDGWEPKDDPYEEHYRRSSDCSFFVFAQHPSKKTKTSRSKKSRTSKASSRLSTQSAASEAPTADLDDQTDQSIMTETTAKAKNTKKSSKSKSKPTKSKKTDTVDTDDQMDVDGAEHTNPEPPKPKRATRGKKRSSDQVEGDGEENDADATEPPQPAPKRRATRTRNSAIEQNYGDLNDAVPAITQEQDEAAPQEEEPKKGRRTKRPASSKGRKTSEVSSTSKAVPNSRIPGDAELDAALEADLENDAPKFEEQDTETANTQTSKKPKSSKKSKSVPEEPVDTKDAPTGQVEKPEGRSDGIPDNDQTEPAEPELPTKSSRSTSKRGTKKSKSRSQEVDPKSRTSPEVDMRDAEAAIPERHESFVSVEIPTKDSAQISEAEPIDEEEVKKSKKTSADKGKKSKTSKRSAEPSDPKEEDVEAVGNAQEQEPADAEIEMPDQKEETPEQAPEPERQIGDRSSRRRSSNIPPKTVERYSDIHEKQFSKSLAEPRTSDIHDDGPNDTSTPGRQASGAVSPLPSAPRSTPSLSPQSSDAENKPPSTKPSASRAPMPSPSKQPSVRVPLAVNTPSPSKRNADAGSLKTSQPWAPIDIEGILFAKGSDKENASKPSGDLSSPEKKMTVEEWIKWNAKNGEERLKQECERLVSHFEEEGGRAMRVLEGIECID